MTIKELEARVKAAEPNGVIKINIIHSDGNEGIWACFATKLDADIYNRDVYGETFDVFLMNQVLMAPPVWGGRLKLKCSGGDNRSSITVDDLAEQMLAAVKCGDYPEKFNES